MARILVNEVEQSTPGSPQTWGELLKELDQILAPKGQIVTAARFDGVDEPSFRDAAVEARSLADCTTVEVASDRPMQLLSTCLSEAESGLAGMRAAVVRLGEMFRGPNLGVANEGLVHVADDLRALVGLTQVLGGPMGIEFHSLRYDERPVAAYLEDLGTLLESLVEAQQATDWLTVADILEYDLEPALRQWQEIFNLLRTFIPGESAPAAEAAR